MLLIKGINVLILGLRASHSALALALAIRKEMGCNPFNINLEELGLLV